MHLSPGDLMRLELQQAASKEATAISQCIERGEVVPTELIVTLVQRAIEASTASAFLIDGFPSTVDEAEILENALGAPHLVLHLDMSLDETKKRLAKRSDARRLNGSNTDMLVQRFEKFQKKMSPLLEHYASRELVRRVDASLRVETVYTAARSLLVPRTLSESSTTTSSTGTAHTEIICLTGGPKSGKSTYAKVRVRYRACVHYSTIWLYRIHAMLYVVTRR